MDYSKLKLLLAKIGSSAKLEAARTAKETGDVAKGIYSSGKAAVEAGLQSGKSAASAAMKSAQEKSMHSKHFTDKFMTPKERMLDESEFLKKLLMSKKRGVGGIVASGVGVGGLGYGVNKLTNKGDE